MKPHQFWCVGRNYGDHAKELGNPIPEKPLIFMKSGNCLQTGADLTFPAFCTEIHHELEIVLLLGENLKPTHWTLGLDFTERKIQNEMKQKGQPWELAKTFKGAAALGPWVELKGTNAASDGTSETAAVQRIALNESTFPPFPTDELSDLEFSLKVNGALRQQGRVSQMLFNFETLLQYLKDHFPLAPGDAVFTGTPSGVGPIKAGDVLNAAGGPLEIQWKIK